MQFIASNKIHNIFESIKATPYKGTIRCRHFAVGIQKNRIVTPVCYNYRRTYVFGKKRGTIHAELSPINYIINTNKSSGYYKHSTRVEKSNIQFKGREEVSKGM
jgi:hypothetical protein